MASISVNPTNGKIVILILSIIVLGVGLHSHFQSAWVKEGSVRLPDGGVVVLSNLYKVCHIKNWAVLQQKCPAISMERYYVAMIIICFILSLANLAASYKVDMKAGLFKMIDIGFHVVSAILLFIAAVVFMVSAVQVYNLWSSDSHNAPGFNVRKSEKLAAGFLTIIQSLLYGGVAFLIFKDG